MSGTAVRPRWRRDIVVFLTGQTVSMFGSMLVQYAIMWHLTLTTKSGLVLALSALFGFLPQAAISIFGGVWADRMNRKVLIIAADSTIAATTLALALLMLSGVDALWLIFATMAIRSAGAGIQMPAMAAMFPQIVPPDKLMRVNGISGSIQTAMMLISPAIAGLLYATASIVSIFFIDVVTAAIGVALLASIAVPTIRTGSDTTYFGDLAEGVRYVWTHRFVRWLLTLSAIVFLLAVAPSFLTPLMLVRNFGDEVWKLTALELAFALGMLVGNIVIASWAASKNRVALLLASSLTFGALSIAMALSTDMWVFFGFMLLVGIVVPFFSTPMMTLLQERVEPERQGRVFGFWGIVMAVTMPVGMVVFGPLADVVSVELLLILAGAGTFVVLMVAILLPSGRHAVREGRPPAKAAEPSGPPAEGELVTTGAIPTVE
jgi:DHA3 family macrolide efflux protein-like MFS transporter